MDETQPFRDRDTPPFPDHGTPPSQDQDTPPFPDQSTPPSPDQDTPPSPDQDTPPFRDRWIAYISGLQDRICSAIETADAKARFTTDKWDREGEGDTCSGGGGTTRTIAAGDLIEKGGVNTSVVWGKVTDTMRTQLKIEGFRWFAAGLSLVLHPKNPYVPTVHANWRYFELYNEAGQVTDRWFGGGSDLTPYYLFKEDARHFHRTFRDAMDLFGKDLYPKYKQWCDEYFVNKHRGGNTPAFSGEPLIGGEPLTSGEPFIGEPPHIRGEMRGIGGVFYDHLRPANGSDAERLFDFQRATGDSFLAAYLPIVDRRRHLPYGEREIEWQEIRRGRYVEFNLIHDRGTLFGLKTGGRTESILMSLPPRARWEYNYQPQPGSPEAELLDVCLHPHDWVARE